MAGVLEIQNMSKSFDGIVVANHVDLSLHAGRVVGLIGPNGAGKTSLFNLVCGVVKPDAGTVLLNGARLDGLKFHQRVRNGLSRTWQHVRLFPSLPVIDNLLIGTHSYPGERLFNVLFGRARLRAYDGAAREKARDVLDKIGLSRVADDLVALGLPPCVPVAAEVRRLPAAYPIYRLGFESRIDTVERWVSDQPNLRSFGRLGLFAHDNTHHALLEAKLAVATIDDRLGWDRARQSFAGHVVED